MAQSGYTPILIYASSTPGALPSAANLTSSASGAELAINYADGKLYFKNSSGVVTLLAGSSSGPAGGSNTQVQYNSSGVLAGSANFTFNGTTVTMANDASVNGLTVGRGAGAVSTNTAVGASALAANTSGSRNTAVGISALASNQTGANNTAVGHYALTVNTASENAAFGDNALFKNTSGTTNTAIGGYGVLFENLTGSYNTAIGSRALYSNTTASNNTAVGYQAGYANQTGTELTLIGNVAGYSNTGTLNTFVGSYSGYWNTSGGSNTALGQGAFQGQTGSGTGSNNTAIGRQALFLNTTASNNTAVGYLAGYSNTTGASNQVFGYEALYSNQTGSNNAAFGTGALYSNTASDNSAFGSGVTAIAGGALVSNTTGERNAAFGNGAASANTTGNYNTALGVLALRSNTTASNNTAVGYQAGYSNTTGVATFGTVTGGSGYTNGTYNNVQLTYSSGTTATTYPTANIVVSGGAVTTVTLVSAGTGFKDTTTVLTAPAASIGGTGSGFTVPVSTLAAATNNTAVGYQAGYSNTTGQYQLFLGYQAGYGVTTGTNNTFVGHLSGESMTTGNKNVILGRYSGNYGGLDIRTASNYIVLSDGDGNPRQWIDNNANLTWATTNLYAYAVQRVNYNSGYTYAGISTTNDDVNGGRAAWGLNAYLATQYSGNPTRNDGTRSGWAWSANNSVSAYNQYDEMRLKYTTAAGTIIDPMAVNNTGGVTHLNTISVGNATPSSSGAGITFPATQSASSNANTLDDYEEGTWTPSVGGNATYSLQDGSYTKIGRMVYLNFDMRISTLGTGSATFIIPSSLPFPFVSAGSARAAGSINWFQSLAISRTAFYLEIDGNGIYLGSSNGSSNTIDETAAFGNSAGIMASIWYTTNT